MERLGDTEWDVILSGTGLKPSLLALALSRSDKKILHVDRNEYYGDSEAAFSLEEAEAWARNNSDDSTSSTFLNASIQREDRDNDIRNPTDENPKKHLGLSFSRAYSLSLSPDIIYSRSKLLPVLVSSKTHQQLEFQAVGSWWVYKSPVDQIEKAPVDTKGRKRSFSRVPNGREDVFGDKSIDLKSKRQLMKFLKFVMSFETQTELWSESRHHMFPDFLNSQFGISNHLQAPLLALTLSPDIPEKTLTSYAVPRIARHLRSIGVFGPGFGAVIPKWGGLSEICQVACRASAVGGGVYMLGHGIDRDSVSPSPAYSSASKADIDAGPRKQVKLTNGEELQTKILVSSDDNSLSDPQASNQSISLQSRAVTIVSSSLSFLFPGLAEGAPIPAVAVVTFPSGSLEAQRSLGTPHPPIYIMVHSSETGECPKDQCVLYSRMLSSSSSHSLIDRAVETLLNDENEINSTGTVAKVLFTLRYTQKGASPISCRDDANSSPRKDSLSFSASSLDLALSDSVLTEVKQVWAELLKSLDEDVNEDDFMIFNERDTLGEAEDVDEF